VQETSRDLERITKLGVLLSEEADEIRESIKNSVEEKKVLDADFDEMEEELWNRDVKLIRMEKEIERLEEAIDVLDDELEYVEKLHALAFFMSPSDWWWHVASNESEQPWREEQITGSELALQKFGEGPYHVMIELELPPNYAQSGTTNQIVVEMAPLKLMPYTVHFFLEQVSQQLYDGTSFGRNGGHVMQAWPLPYFANADENLHAPFIESGLDKLAFQEYNTDYPHDKYTLGFAGRPGGMEFYISLEDNTVINAPDPCFGKIVHGFEALERMKQIPTIDGDSIMVENIGIKMISILNNYEDSS